MTGSRALYSLIALTGLRRGEAAGLRWEDVDLATGLLHVRQQLVQLGYAVEVGLPKTSKGVRTVALAERTLLELQEHRAQQRHEAGRLGLPAPEYVFTREDGHTLHPEYVSRHFQVLTRRAGLPEIRLHDLRHTHASHALAAGVPLKVVQERLGHSSITLTADTYTHVLPEVSRAAADLVARLITELPSAPRYPRAPEDDSGPSPRQEKGQVSTGAPPGTRTPNPRIKSPLLCQLS